MAHVKGKRVHTPKIVKQKEKREPTYKELQEQVQRMQKTLSYYVDMEIAFSECKERCEEYEEKLYLLKNMMFMIGDVKNPIRSK